MDRDVLRRLRQPGHESPELRMARELLEQLDARGDALSLRARDVAWASLRSAGRLLELEGADETHPVRQYMEHLKQKLQNLDHAEVEQLRAAIANGFFTPVDFRARIEAMPAEQWNAFVGQLFDINSESEDVRMSVILRLSSVVTSNDVFVDLHSQSGLTSLVIAWLTKVPCIGLTPDGAPHEPAERTAQRLSLRQVQFIQSNLQDAPLEQGTLFFLHPPPAPEGLAAMVERLGQLAQTHAFRVVAQDRAIEALAATDWAQRKSELGNDDLTLFEAGR